MIKTVKSYLDLVPEDDHHHEGEGEGPHEERGPADLDDIISHVDEILEHDDKDKDGYINWSEFMTAQKEERN